MSWVPIQHLGKYFWKYIFFSFTSIYILKWSLSALTQLSQSGVNFIFAGNWNFVRIKKPKSPKRNTEGYFVMNGLKLQIARQTVQVWLQNWLYKTTFSCNRYFSFRYTFCNNSLSYVWKKSPIIIHFFRYFACMKFNVLPKEVTNKENAFNVSPPPFSLFSISSGNKTTA